MSTWLAIVATLIGVLGGGAGIYSVLTIGPAKRKIAAEAVHIKASADETVADTVKVLIGGASDLVEPLKRELGEARAELHTTRLDLAKLQRECARFEQRLMRLMDMIHDPYMTMDRLRVTVPQASEPSNGHG